jgi:hypothetical protein
MQKAWARTRSALYVRGLTGRGRTGRGAAHVGRIWWQPLERAEFAADRSHRPVAVRTTGLVAWQLEKDWEPVLVERQRQGEGYDRFAATRPRTLMAAEPEQIRPSSAHERQCGPGYLWLRRQRVRFVISRPAPF